MRSRFANFFNGKVVINSGCTCRSQRCATPDIEQA